MNLLDRVKNTFSFFRTGLEPVRNVPMRGRKKTPLKFNSRSTDQPQWSMVDYESFYNEGFAANSVIYAAIMVKVRAVSQVDLIAVSPDSKGESKENFTPIEPNNTRRDFSLDEFATDENQRLANLLNRPNKYMSGSEFQQLQTTYLNLTGNAFTVIVREKTTNIPISLWPLNPVHIQIVPKVNGEIMGYIYNPKGEILSEGLPILPDDMMHVKLPNPSDPLQGLGFGLSPIAPLAKSADVDNQLTTFLKVFFEHGAMPSGAIKLKDMMLDEDSIAEIKEKFMATYGNYENWADIAVLDMTMDYERIGLTFDEMDFSNLDGRNESRMLLPFGVPAEIMPIRLGLEGSTFANKEEARKWFWQDTMIYELNLFLDEYKSFLATENGATPKWDLAKVDALKENTKEQIEGAVALIGSGVPPNVAFTTVGLEVENYDGIDEPVQPPSPFGDFADDNENDTPNDIPSNTETEVIEESDQKRLNIPTIRDRLYTKIDNLAQSHETAFSEAAELAFDDEKNNVLAMVQDAKKKALVQKATVDGITLLGDLSEYFFKDGKANWRDKFAPVIVTEVSDVGNFWKDQLGLTFNLRNIEGEAWFQDYMLEFANPITDTSNKTIHDLISLGLEDGWSNDLMANRLSDVYDSWTHGGMSATDFDWLHKPAIDPKLGTRVLQWRRELIARTETTRAANAGANNFFKEWGVTQKEWLSTADNRTRKHHRAMSGDVVDIEGKFTSGLGNKLSYPGDPNAPLSDTAQCRCTILPAGDVLSQDEIMANVNNTQQYRDFRETDSADELKEFENLWEKKIAELPQDQQDAYAKYTSSFHEELNGWLRHGKKGFRFDESRLEFLETNRNLLDAAGKAHKLEQNTVLYRNVKVDSLQFWGVETDTIETLVGRYIGDKGLMSTSVDGRAFSQNPVRMIINAPKDTPGSYIKSVSSFSSENEFLLPRDSKLKVTRVEKILNREGTSIREIKIWADYVAV